MEERKLNLEMALAEYANNLASTYDLSYVNTKGERVETTLTNPNNVRLMVALDESQRIGKRLDLARCLLFATIERTLNQDKALGISTRDFIMQKWHYSKATTNQYLAIGLKFFTNTGNEKVSGISSFTVGQIIPFLAFVNDFPTIGGVDTDYKFLEWFITNGYISPEMTTTELEGIAKILKEGYLPKEWVSESTDSKLPYFVKCADMDGETDLQFPLCPYLEKEEIAPKMTNESAAEQSIETENEQSVEVTLSATVRSFLTTLQDMPMSPESRNELSELSEQFIKWAIKASKEEKDEQPKEKKGKK